MRNSRGFSWPETILTLSITSLLAVTLLPLMSQFTVQLEDKKRDYYASVVMYEAIKMYVNSNVLAGSIQMEQSDYSFVVDETQICVSYEGMREEKNSCVSIAY